jgi:hypothetical protein
VAHGSSVVVAGWNRTGAGWIVGADFGGRARCSPTSATDTMVTAVCIHIVHRLLSMFFKTLMIMPSERHVFPIYYYGALAKKQAGVQSARNIFSQNHCLANIAQIGPTTVYACGNAGNATATRLTFGLLIYRPYAGSYQMIVAVAGVNVTRISIAQSAPNSGLASLVGMSGAVVSPTIITSGYVDQNPANFYTTINVDVPCSIFSDYSNTNLAVTHEPCTDVFQVDNVAVNACVSETCGGQNIMCPGLKATRACTPGYDCMPGGHGRKLYIAVSGVQMFSGMPADQVLNNAQLFLSQATSCRAVTHFAWAKVWIPCSGVTLTYLPPCQTSNCVWL